MNRAKPRSFWRLGEIMIQKDWIDWPQLRAALASQQVERRLIGEILVDRGLVSRKQVLRALALQYGTDFVELEKVRVDQDALEAVPKECAYQHKLVPIEKGKDYFVVATSNPSNYWAKAVLHRLTGVPEIRSVLACPDDIDQSLEKHYGLQEQVA